MTIPAGFSSVRKQSISRKTSSLKSWTRLRKAIHFSEAFFKASKYQFLLCSAVKMSLYPQSQQLRPAKQLPSFYSPPARAPWRQQDSMQVLTALHSKHLGEKNLTKKVRSFQLNSLIWFTANWDEDGEHKSRKRQGSKRHVTLLLGTAFGQPKSILKLQLQWLSQLFLTKQLCQSQAGKGVTDTAMLAQAHTVIQSQPLSCEDGVVKLGKPCHESCVYSSTLTLLCWRKGPTDIGYICLTTHDIYSTQKH